MPDDKEDFTVLFKKSEELAEDLDIQLTDEEISEHDAIRALRQIVLESQVLVQASFTTT